jgi:predicted nucleotidyltransferase
MRYDKKMSMSDLKEKLHKIAAAVFEGTPVLFAYLYGSYAKGLSHPFSDLDVGIYVEGLDTKACLNLELLLSLSIDEKLGHVVQSEVRVLNHLPLVVKGRIMAGAELIYSRDEDKRIEFETQVRKAYFDFLPVIHQYQDAYRERALSVPGDDIR